MEGFPMKFRNIFLVSGLKIKDMGEGSELTKGLA
jgi:hypothetical protein